jgi:hypothetical protein
MLGVGGFGFECAVVALVGRRNETAEPLLTSSPEPLLESWPVLSTRSPGELLCPPIEAVTHILTTSLP